LVGEFAEIDDSVAGEARGTCEGGRSLRARQLHSARFRAMNPASMLRGRDIIRAFRVPALWLLVLCVFCGPVGLGASSAFADASKPCGKSCPCDEERHAEHADEKSASSPCDDDHDPDDQGEGAPCDDGCPDGCPNCGCCVGIAMAAVPPAVALAGFPSVSSRVHAQTDVRSSGARTGIFRPPRSLT
jgi:hypothetical protein